MAERRPLRRASGEEAPEFSSPDRLESFRSEHQMLATVFEAGDRSVLRNALAAHLTATEEMLKQAYRVLAPDATASSTMPELETNYIS